MAEVIQSALKEIGARWSRLSTRSRHKDSPNASTTCAFSPSHAAPYDPYSAFGAVFDSRTDIGVDGKIFIDATQLDPLIDAAFAGQSGRGARAGLRALYASCETRSVRAARLPAAASGRTASGPRASSCRPTEYEFPVAGRALSAGMRAGHSLLVRRIVTALLVLAVASVAVFTLVAARAGRPGAVVAERTSFGADRQEVERVGLNSGSTGRCQCATRTGSGTWPRRPRDVAAHQRRDLCGLSGTRAGDRSCSWSPRPFALVAGSGAGVLGALLPSGLSIGCCALGAPAVSVPSFYLGALLVLLFAVTMHWLPAEGESAAELVVAAVVTLGLASCAVMARVVRVGLAEAVSRPYVTTALSRGGAAG